MDHTSSQARGEKAPDNVQTIMPMTRAQQFQWYMENWVIVYSWQTPANLDVDVIEEALKLLAVKFETLRTKFQVVDGYLRQVVTEPRVEISVGHLVNASSPPLDDLVLQFYESSCAQVGATTVQFHLYQRAARPGWLVMLADHVTMDSVSVKVIARQVNKLCKSADYGVPSESADWLQPTDLAEAENASVGRTERSRAYRYLEKHFQNTPAWMYPNPLSQSQGLGPRYYEARLALPGGVEVLHRITELYSIRPAAAVLAAFTMMICHHTGFEQCVVGIEAANRHLMPLSQVVGATAQRVPLLITSPMCSSYLETAKHVQSRSILAYRYSWYEPLDLLEIRSRMSWQRGIDLNTDVTFNFYQVSLDDRQRDTADLSEQPAKCSWQKAPGTDRPYEESSTRLSLDVQHGSRTVLLNLLVDTVAVDSREVEGILYGIEAILRRASDGLDSGVDILAEKLQSSRRNDLWQSLDNCWISVPQVTALVEKCSRSADIAVFIRNDRRQLGISRYLHAFVASADPGLTPSIVRQRIVDELSLHPAGMTPHYFTLVERPPADQAKLSAWLAERVLDEGTGHRSSMVNPTTSAEQAVARALVDTHGPLEISMADSYLRAGGDLEKFYGFAAALAEYGYTGFTFKDAAGIRSLASISAALTGGVKWS
ncbi:condensation domain-containing protein [Actinocrispum wychmicini]|uniref:Condensation domain-containing protein n=1 Tax=Actinocrispum wychmicini TaxID=1213861 RepID=A0A4V2S7C6_9PSEU|nr:condensation domain-containing protein [Actinocrispum wychmicini]TCO59350.1 condensation domain-containing protein [Actinocrispum wychmicini]